MPLQEECVCVQDATAFSQKSRLCQHCPWRLVAGALAGVDFQLSRQDFMKQLIRDGHVRHDALVVKAIAEQYGLNYTAASLSFRRARRKWVRE